MEKQTDEWIVFKNKLDEETYFEILEKFKLRGRKQALEDVNKILLKYKWTEKDWNELKKSLKELGEK